MDAAAGARRALELMRDEGERRVQVEAVRAAAPALHGDAAAEHLLDLYELTCDSPPTPAGARDRGDAVTHAYLSEDAFRLVGPHGVLSPDLERPLLALATHPQIAQPLFGAIKAGYRASNRLRRLAGRAGARNGRSIPTP